MFGPYHEFNSGVPSLQNPNRYGGTIIEDIQGLVTWGTGCDRRLANDESLVPFDPFHVYHVLVSECLPYPLSKEMLSTLLLYRLGHPHNDFTALGANHG